MLIDPEDYRPVYPPGHPKEGQPYIFMQDKSPNPPAELVEQEMLYKHLLECDNAWQRLMCVKIQRTISFQAMLFKKSAKE